MPKILIPLVLAFTAGLSFADAPGKLGIATDATFPPFHFVNEDGAVTGFDVELAREVAQHAGYKADVRVVAYQELFQGIRDGTHDLVAATTGITAERREQYLFSQPYFETCQAAVVRTGANEPRRLIELRERPIGASGSGTSRQAMYETLAGEHLRVPDGQGPTMLASRRIDAWIVDEFDAVAFARASFGEYVVLPDPVATEAYGFVMAKGRRELKKELDAALEALRASGRIDELKKRFGVVRDREWPVRCGHAEP